MLTYAPYCSLYVVKKVCIPRDLTFGKRLLGNVVQNYTDNLYKFLRRQSEGRSPDAISLLLNYTCTAISER